MELLLVFMWLVIFWTLLALIAVIYVMCCDVKALLKDIRFLLEEQDETE